MNFIKTANLFLIVLIISSKLNAKTLTLDEAYKSAINLTESTPIAKSQVRESEARIDESKGAFLPTLNANVNYTQQEKAFSTINEKDQLSSKISLNQSLYSGGKDNANLKAAESDKSVQEYNLLNTQKDLYITVARNYYLVLSSQKEVENIKMSIELTKKRVSELRKRSRIGKSRNIEVLTAETQLSLLEAQLIAANGNEKIAINNFSKTTGITNIDSETTLDDSFTLPKVIDSLEFYLSASSKRPDIQALEEKINSIEFSRVATQALLKPTLDFNANYYPYRYHFSNTASTWDASLNLNFRFFSGGIVQAQTRVIEEKKFQAELQLRLLQRNVENEIKEIYNSLFSYLSQVNALEKAVSATEENYKEQEKDYRYSLSTNLDVLQSLNTFHETKRTLDKTKYLALSAMAELKATSNQIQH